MKNIFLMILSFFSKDKIAHIGVTGMMTHIIFSLTGSSMWSFIGAVVIGVLYEFYQKLSNRGHFQLSDIVADVLGAILYLVFYNISIGNYWVNV